ncbi:transposase [Streptomyces sp. NPDC056178]|uniref:transposase n=1 Tax=Streptomyces sp. NPDC056178 TaxID=3345735 RepID=UPI0035D8DC52
MRRRRPSRTATPEGCPVIPGGPGTTGHPSATTVETWWPEILAFLHAGITNAGSEGTDWVIKTIARDAYGFRTPGNQRSRTRCATTRRARGHLDAR